MKNKNQKLLKELFCINKVITLLKFKSAVFLIGGAIERANSIAKSHSDALSMRLQLETL